MDIDVNILGPYAKILNFQGNTSAGPVTLRAAPTTKTKRPNRIFEGIYKKQNIKFLRDGEDKRKERQLGIEGHRKERRSQIFMNHRKPNMAGISQEIHEESSSSNDSTLGTSNDNLDVQRLQLKAVVGNKSNNTAKNSSKSTNSNAVKSSSNKASNPDILNNNNSRARNVQEGEPVIKDARRERLQKWKKEKEVEIMAVRRNQKQPFKVGAIPTAAATGTAKIVNNVTSSNVQKNIVSNNVGGPSSSSSTFASKSKPIQNVKSHPVTVSKGVNNTQASRPGAKSEETRRVTRAMSKAQPVPGTSAVNGKTTQGMKPAIQKMKNLNISEKTSSSNIKAGGNAINGRPATGTRNLKLGSSQSQPTSANIQSLQKKAPVITSTTSSKSRAQGLKPAASTSANKTNPIRQQTNHPPQSPNVEVVKESTVETSKPEVSIKKKLKPKAIDDDYIDFNLRFSTACHKLKGYRREWSDLLDEPQIMEKISEKIHGDILSSLGKVKLLLESKLPQFGQLLYSYLCQEVDPNPVLPCDLQGWWDVASIQLEAVDKIFDELTRLKNNNWDVSPPLQQEELMETCSQDMSAENDTKSKSGALQRRPPHRPNPKSTTTTRVQASGGLKAFLANKRKMMINNEKADNLVPEPEELNAKKGNETFMIPNSEKTFEGGFFTISSPKPVSTPDSFRKRQENMSTSLTSVTPASAVPSSLRTPARRSSQRLSNSNEENLRRVSMCILGVRQSMGSLMKIGACPISAEDRDVKMDTSGNNEASN